MTEVSKPCRQLGLFDAIMIVMGGIVGAGIFANSSEVARLDLSSGSQSRHSDFSANDRDYWRF